MMSESVFADHGDRPAKNSTARSQPQSKLVQRMYTLSQKKVHTIYFGNNFSECKPIQLIFNRNIADKICKKPTYTGDKLDIYSLWVAGLHCKMTPIFSQFQNVKILTSQSVSHDYQSDCVKCRCSIFTTASRSSLSFNNNHNHINNNAIPIIWPSRVSFSNGSNKFWYSSALAWSPLNIPTIWNKTTHLIFIKFAN